MKLLNLLAALLLCVFNATLVCVFPLLGLAVLPSLFACVCWAGAALRELRFFEPSRRAVHWVAPQASGALATSRG